jgi:hypothetical protein
MLFAQASTPAVPPAQTPDWIGILVLIALVLIPLALIMYKTKYDSAAGHIKGAPWGTVGLTLLFGMFLGIMVSGFGPLAMLRDGIIKTGKDAWAATGWGSGTTAEKKANPAPAGDRPAGSVKDYVVFNPTTNSLALNPAKVKDLPPGWRVSWTQDRKTASVLVDGSPTSVVAGDLWVYFDPDVATTAAGHKQFGHEKLR